MTIQPPRQTLPTFIWQYRLAWFLFCLAIFCYGVFRPEPQPDLSDQSDKRFEVLAFLGLGLCSALFASGRRWGWAVWPAPVYV